VCRDNAATDVERVWRGCRARAVVHRKKQFELTRSKSNGDEDKEKRSGSSIGITCPRNIANCTALGDTKATSGPGAAGKPVIETQQPSMGSASAQLFKKYREQRDQKRDLKKKLKKFDEDFLRQHGRNPKKSDKEVIRPMYQSYHEVSD